MSTRKCEITLNCFAAVFLGENVVDLKREWKGKLRQPTVFSAPRSSFPDTSNQFTIHCRVESDSELALLMSRRAFDCITPSKVPMCK